MTHQFEYLTEDDLIEITKDLLGDPPPIRDLGLLSAAAARPQASAFGEDAYPDGWTKAAAMLHSIVKNHPLIDGNKRLGWLAASSFLEINHMSVSGASNADVYDLVIMVATDELNLDEIAARLKQMHEQTSP